MKRNLYYFETPSESNSWFQFAKNLESGIWEAMRAIERLARSVMNGSKGADAVGLPHCP